MKNNSVVADIVANQRKLEQLERKRWFVILSFLADWRGQSYPRCDDRPCDAIGVGSRECAYSVSVKSIK